jgi:hypothetical protein
VLEIAELDQYRAQVAHDWREGSAGRRVVLAFEGLLAVALGVGMPVADVWWFLKP